MCKVWGMKIENLPRCPDHMNTTSKLCFKENTQALSSKEAYKQIIGALIDAKNI
jgi:phage terminase small subunit